MGIETLVKGAKTVGIIALGAAAMSVVGDTGELSLSYADYLAMTAGAYGGYSKDRFNGDVAGLTALSGLLYDVSSAQNMQIIFLEMVQKGGAFILSYLAMRLVRSSIYTPFTNGE